MLPNTMVMPDAEARPASEGAVAEATPEAAPRAYGATQVRVLVADDCFAVRAGLRALLEDKDTFQVVGEAKEGPELFQQVERLQPDVVIMEIDMRGAGGTEAIRTLHDRYPEMRVIVLSSQERADVVRQAFRVGAAAYVAKDDDVVDLARVVAASCSGETYMSQRISAALVNNYVRGEGEAGKAELLTARQRQLLKMIGEGKSTRVISETLGITVRTVHTHRSRIMKRLDIHNEAGLVAYAVKMGLVQF